MQHHKSQLKRLMPYHKKYELELFEFIQDNYNNEKQL